MRYAIFSIIILTAPIVFMGDSTIPEIVLLQPIMPDSLMREGASTFLFSVAKAGGDSLTISTPWELEIPIDISTKKAREEFPKTFYKLFPSKFSIRLLQYKAQYHNGFSEPESTSFSFYDKMTIRNFWQHPALALLLKRAQNDIEASSIYVHLKGWRDTAYIPVYDDPLNDSRYLYKVGVNFLLGWNELYATTATVESKPLLISANYVSDRKPVEERTTRFHNSSLEKNCVPCHPGLPSEQEGASMTADCGVCHKALLNGNQVHAPVEMKECGTCHEWSSTTLAISIKQGIPDLCTTCHAEKKELLENATVQHPVASECLTCHSPHLSKEKHLLRDNQTALCGSCHPGLDLNHPVGRHPVRFAIIQDKNEEISCASCHNPHGSQYKSLSRTSDHPMEICLACHNK